MSGIPSTETAKPVTKEKYGQIASQTIFVKNINEINKSGFIDYFKPCYPVVSKTLKPSLEFVEINSEKMIALALNLHQCVLK